MVMRRTTSVFWSWVWLIGWVILLGLLIAGATTTTAGTAAAIIAGIVILIGWVMALVRGAQEKRWVFFTIMLLLGNTLGPFAAVYYVWRTYSDLTRA
jgi:hypothetical protein